jgi:release factor glutamine methyltransferase
VTAELTWATLQREVAATLRDAGLATAAQEARWIVEEASGYEPVEVAAQPVPERGMVAVDRMLERRRQGEPIQYVLGRWAFRTLDLMVDGRVLIPRPETEVVAGHALAEVDRRQGDRVLVVDLGTGSGAIGLSVAAERDGAEVWLTDTSPDALAVARANLAGLGRPAARVTVVEGAWFDALPDDARGTLDVVVSNPPYIAQHEELPAAVVDWEPASALVAGPEGTEDLVRLVDGARDWLAPGGALVLELAPWQAAPMAERAVVAGYTDVRVEPDLAGLDRVLIAHG